MSDGLKSHFDAALPLLERRAELAIEVAAWRTKVRDEGLVPMVLLKLAREHIRNAEQRRKAEEQAEIEELYRQGLDLPLFSGRAAE
jgi:hypothetical protein